MAESHLVTHIGVLTAGGDCPGLNAAIRGVVARATAQGHSVSGIEDGWQGLMGGRVRPLGRDDVRGILTRGGTILGTSRTDPYVHGDGLASLMPALTATGIDSVVVIGGDGSLRTAARLGEEGLAVVGVPKTIDNDIEGTEVSFGFDTAVQIVTDAVDRLTTTAEAHNRIMLVEVMGRQSGWIAVHAGLAGGAEAILVPEDDYDLDDLACRLVARHNSGRDYSIVIVAEGVRGPSGSRVTMGTDHGGFERLGGVSAVIAAELEARTGYETRVMILGHLQRGGTPTAFDRVLATRMGIRAAEAVIDGDHGMMVACLGSDLILVPLTSAVAVPRLVPGKRLAELDWFLA
jgi:6-phosphofructokinase 1